MQIQGKVTVTVDDVDFEQVKVAADILRETISDENTAQAAARQKYDWRCLERVCRRNGSRLARFRRMANGMWLLRSFRLSLRPPHNAAS